LYLKFEWIYYTLFHVQSAFQQIKSGRLFYDRFYNSFTHFVLHLKVVNFVSVFHLSNETKQSLYINNFWSPFLSREKNSNKFDKMK